MFRSLIIHGHSSMSSHYFWWAPSKHLCEPESKHKRLLALKIQITPDGLRGQSRHCPPNQKCRCRD